MAIVDHDMMDFSGLSSVSGSFPNEDVDSNSTTDWCSIKTTLLQIVSSQSGPFGSVPDQERPTFGTGFRDDMYLREREHILQTVNIRGGPIVTWDMEDDFRPSYIEDVYTVESNDTAKELARGSNPPGLDESFSRMDLGSTTRKMEESPSEDIFRVWDLGISDEQDDVTQLLGTTFVDDIPFLIQPHPDDSTAWKDNLAARVAHISLKENSR
ncbi:hypothetical protein RND81_11G168400 [Saponaria officinalis]|uniref:Uncharacterized protein n=1 Tax=Saponaria officinalis TaxID=3572 RepID=A0AAW1HM48_SAPOF